MKNSTYRLIALCLSLVIVVGGAMLLYRNLGDRIDPGDLTETTQGETTEAQTTEAPHADEEIVPNITLTDLEGNEVKLHDLHGKPIVMNFWATWCDWCLLEMPYFQNQYLKFGNDVHFMMVNMGENFDDLWGDAVSLIQDEGYTFPVYFDDNGDAAALFGLNSLPATVFIDEDGYLVTGQVGAISEETLEDNIEALLAK